MSRGSGSPGPAVARRGVVTGTVIEVLRHADKLAAGAVPVALVARLGLPALGGLVLLAILALGAACWVIGSSDRRTE